MILRITRGRTYGTLLVDLQRHQILDLLPDRKAETAAARTLVPSRNPSGEPRSWRRLRFCGSDGGTSSCPVCRPVPSPDQAFRKSVEGFLSRHLAAHRTSVDLESRATLLSPVQGKRPPKKNPKHAQESQAKREERLAQYQQVVARLRAGLLASGHRCSGRGRSCHRLALVENGTFPEQKSPQRAYQARSPSQSGCRAVGSGLSQHRTVASGTGRRRPHYHLSQRLQTTGLLPSGRQEEVWL
jgi:hypothetical protein